PHNGHSARRQDFPMRCSVTSWRDGRIYPCKRWSKPWSGLATSCVSCGDRAGNKRRESGRGKRGAGDIPFLRVLERAGRHGNDYSCRRALFAEKRPEKCSLHQGPGPTVTVTLLVTPLRVSVTVLDGRIPLQFRRSAENALASWASADYSARRSDCPEEQTHGEVAGTA